MTERLYYEDAYMDHFAATVVRKEKDYVVLSKTAFYPTGGGQPHDLGFLNGIEVTNVELVDGEIRHYLASELIDKEVEGTIDWKRRFDHMQQHAGQHILSAAFDELFQYKTVSFHLGKDYATIDLETEQVSQEELEAVEELANQIILKNIPIETKWVTEEELSDYPLRKPTKLKEDIRLVIIPGYDYNACGGTHPSFSGEIGQLKIVSIEKQKKQIRVEFLCGNRILSHFSLKDRILKELIATLSSPEEQLVKTVHTLLDRQNQLEKQLKEAQDQMITFEAKELRNQFKEKDVIAAYQNRSIQSLQKLAKLVVEQDPTCLCILIVENHDKVQIVGARGTERTEKMNVLIQPLLASISGKGGGSDSFAQGGGDLFISAEELVQKALLL